MLCLKIYIPVLEVYREETTRHFEGNRVLISHYGKREYVRNTLSVETCVHLEEGLVADLFGRPHACIGVRIFLVA